MNQSFLIKATTLLAPWHLGHSNGSIWQICWISRAPILRNAREDILDAITPGSWSSLPAFWRKLIDLYEQ
jgi:hypothetical protein